MLRDAVLERQRRDQAHLRVEDSELARRARPIGAVAHGRRQIVKIEDREFLELKEARRESLPERRQPEGAPHVRVGRGDADEVAMLLSHGLNPRLPVAGFDGWAATPRFTGPCYVFAEAGQSGRPPWHDPHEYGRAGGRLPARP